MVVVHVVADSNCNQLSSFADISAITTADGGGIADDLSAETADPSEVEDSEEGSLSPEGFSDIASSVPATQIQEVSPQDGSSTTSSSSTSADGRSTPFIE